MGISRAESFKEIRAHGVIAASCLAATELEERLPEKFMKGDIGTWWSAERREADAGGSLITQFLASAAPAKDGGDTRHGNRTHLGLPGLEGLRWRTRPARTARSRILNPAENRGRRSDELNQEGDSQGPKSLCDVLRQGRSRSSRSKLCVPRLSGDKQLPEGRKAAAWYCKLKRGLSKRQQYIWPRPNDGSVLSSTTWFMRVTSTPLMLDKMCLQVRKLRMTLVIEYEKYALAFISAGNIITRTLLLVDSLSMNNRTCQGGATAPITPAVDVYNYFYISRSFYDYDDDHDNPNGDGDTNRHMAVHHCLRVFCLVLAHSTPSRGLLDVAQRRARWAAGWTLDDVPPREAALSRYAVFSSAFETAACFRNAHTRVLGASWTPPSGGNL
ncbi:hypothetical protein K466DRAFT_570223 [Polyporus arcularius HHB13444]|uniref:Uncharacterized protein n=1 Tax=Polyporus arcularius HHB13444 TaxID=1314778 RepID=A0A5C3NRS9_9APHY|nr:hypothetical protein K466DRAFT_570223 [Polyporus arcularius HHB13444]